MIVSAAYPVWLPLASFLARTITHHADGVEVRKLLHKTRSIAIENFNEHFKTIFDVHGSVSTIGFVPTQRFMLAAFFFTNWLLCIAFSQSEPAPGLQSFA